MIFRAVTHPDTVMWAVSNHIHAAAFTTDGFWPYFCYKTGTWGPSHTLFQSRVPLSLEAAEPGGSPPGQAVPLQASPLVANRSSPSITRIWVHPAAHGWPHSPARESQGCRGLWEWGCRHTLSPPNHLPALEARQVGLEDLGD